MEQILREINVDVKNILNIQIETSQTRDVPSDEDPGVTFGIDRKMKAKQIETAVLFIDIRRSTLLNQVHKQEAMARLYAAFVSSMITAAEYYGGAVRNIIGDRIMVVFPTNLASSKALQTAWMMNAISVDFIDHHFSGNEIKCGIGVDFGKMMSIKVGVPKMGKERSAHKNLVWVGNTANVASKLTDIANKDGNPSILISNEAFEQVKKEHPNWDLYKNFKVVALKAQGIDQQVWGTNSGYFSETKKAKS